MVDNLEIDVSDELGPVQRENTSPIIEEVSDEQAGDVAFAYNVLSPAPSLENYNSIKESVQLTGSHPDLMQIDAVIKDQASQRVIDESIAAMTDLSLTESDKDGIASGLAAELDKIKNKVSAIDEATIALANSYAPTDPEEAEIHEGQWKDNVQSYLQMSDRLARAQAADASELQLDAQTVWEGLSLFVPAYDGIAWKNFIDDRLGSEWSTNPKVLVPGELAQVVKEHVADLVAQGKYDEVEGFYYDMLEYTKENAGLFSGNELLGTLMTMDAFAEVSGSRDPKDIDWNRWIADAGGAIDAIPFLGWAKKGITSVKTGTKLSRAKRLIDSNIRMAEEAGAKAADDAEVASVLGETPASLHGKFVLPKHVDWKDVTTPQSFGDAVLDGGKDSRQLLTTAAAVADFIQHSPEKLRAAERLKETLHSANNGVVWVADTTVERVADGWEAVAVIGKNKRRGWNKQHKAHAFAEEAFGEGFEIVGRKTPNDTPSVNLDGATEFFVRVKDKQKVVFDNSDFAFTVGGAANKFAFDPSSIFSKWISQKGGFAHDRMSQAEHALGLYFEPVGKLGLADQNIVSKLLSRGDQHEKIYGTQEIKRLAAALGAKKVQGVVDAYTSARQGFDTMFSLENATLLDKLTKGGWSHLRGPNDFNAFGKYVDDVELAQVRRVYDPATDGMVDYAGTGRIARVNRRIEVGEEATPYVLVGKGSELAELPQFVLRYRRGYVPRLYKENYFIKESRLMTVNGQPEEVSGVVKVANGLKSADRTIEQLRTANPGRTYIPQHDRAISQFELDSSIESMYEGYGQLFYSKRGSHLTGPDGALAETVEPLNAALNGIRSVSKKAMMGPYLDDLKTRWINTYGKFNGGEFPSDIAAIISKDVRDTKEITQARRMFEYIRRLDGFSGDALATRRSAIKLADYFESKGQKVLADGARYIADVNPNAVGWVRARNFDMNLGTDPFRQLFLQPSQLLYTAALAPMEVVKNTRVGYHLSRAARYEWDLTRSADELRGLSKLLDMEPSEFVLLIKQFRASGFGVGVKNHEAARDAAKGMELLTDKSVPGVISARVANTYNKAMSFPRKFFARGEEINMGGHWMLARSRVAKREPDLDLFSDEAGMKISAEARGLALSMNQAGDFQYQRGFMSLPMQYFAIQHKALLGMWSNQNLTRTERLKVALGQLALWGPTGVGLGFIPPLLAEKFGVTSNELVEDGIMEASINTMLSLASGEDVDIDIGGSIAPVGGALHNNIMVILFSKLSDGQLSYTDLIGPTKSNFNRIKGAMRAAELAFNVDPDQVNYELVSKSSLDQILRVFSSYNRLSQSRVMMATGNWVDGKGKAIVPTNAVESWAHGLFGLQGNKVAAAYELQKMLSSPVSIKLTDAQDTADKYYEHLMDLTNMSLRLMEDGVPHADVRARYESEVAVHNALVASQGEYAEIIMRKVHDRANKAMESKQDNLIDKMSRLYATGENKNVFEYAHSQGLIDESTYKSMKELYDYAWGED